MSPDMHKLIARIGTSESAINQLTSNITGVMILIAYIEEATHIWRRIRAPEELAMEAAWSMKPQDTSYLRG